MTTLGLDTNSDETDIEAVVKYLDTGRQGRVSDLRSLVPAPEKNETILSQGQQARQRARGRNGRYEDMNRCEGCNKPLGAADYYSDRRCDTSPQWGGRGLVLCKRCAVIVDALPDDKAIAFLDSKKH